MVSVANIVIISVTSKLFLKNESCDKKYVISAKVQQDNGRNQALLCVFSHQQSEATAVAT